MVSAALIAVCGIMSFIAYKSSYWIMKFLAGIMWFVLGMWWVANPIISTPSPAQNGLIIGIFIIGVAFIFMPFWFTKESNGEEHSHFRLPGISHEEEPEVPMMTREQRITAHREKVNKALNGERWS